jgi:hypothetical protein
MLTGADSKSLIMNIAKTMLVASSLILGAALIIPQTAQATVVNFDDLSGFGVVANGYGGINWDSNWSHYDSFQSPYNASSFATRVYANYAKFVPEALSDVAFSFSGPVVFQGAYFAGHSDLGRFTISVFLAGILKATTAIFSPSATPTFVSSGYAGAVDKVVIHGNAGFYVMDDVTFGAARAVSTVPVPGAIWLLLSGIAGLAGFRRARS